VKSRKYVAGRARSNAEEKGNSEIEAETTDRIVKHQKNMIVFRVTKDAILPRSLH